MDAQREVEPKYFGNVLSAFEAGVQMDLRLKIAIDLLKSPMFGTVSGQDAEYVAKHALDVAENLVEYAAARGLMKALPEDGELNAVTRKHIERAARAQVVGQVVGGRIMAEEQRIGPVGASSIPPYPSGMHG